MLGNVNLCIAAHWHDMVLFADCCHLVRHFSFVCAQKFHISRYHRVLLSGNKICAMSISHHLKILHHSIIIGITPKKSSPVSLQYHMHRHLCVQIHAHTKRYLGIVMVQVVLKPQGFICHFLLGLIKQTHWCQGGRKAQTVK